MHEQVNRDAIYKKVICFLLNEQGAHLTVDILGATEIFAVGRVRFVTPKVFLRTYT